MFWNSPKVFPGWPKTKCNQNKGEVVISASYLTPEGAGWRDTLSGLSTLATIICGILYSERAVLGWPHMAAAVIALVVNYNFILPFILKARVWLVFSVNHIKIRTLFSFWKNYERGNDGYGFKHKPHQKGEEEALKVGKETKAYFKKSHQIYINHYQGFFVLPGIYGWEKSNQLYNRIMGVEMWVHNRMPRVWKLNSDAEYKDDSLNSSKEGWFKVMMKKVLKMVLSIVFFVYGFFIWVFVSIALFYFLQKGVGFIFGPEAKQAVVLFFENLPEWIQAIGILGNLCLCIYSGIDEVRNQSKKYWNKKELNTQEEIIDVEFHKA